MPDLNESDSSNLSLEGLFGLADEIHPSDLNALVENPADNVEGVFDEPEPEVEPSEAEPEDCEADSFEYLIEWIESV